MFSAQNIKKGYLFLDNFSIISPKQYCELLPSTSFTVQVCFLFMGHILAIFLRIVLFTLLHRTAILLFPINTVKLAFF